ncbi:MAG: nitroreductase family deazaflavin-dependent oxidoreductase [Chloroflexales bacterium]|nr:nitroreductase family deazaflavin-dependent oxidoreductase [Chloroflexales bacterium]
MKTFTAAHTVIYRLTGGRVGGRIGATPVLLLTTTGGKTGKRRTRPLVYVADGNSYVVAGSAGSTSKNPAWAQNLLANPSVEIQVGSQVLRMRAETVQETEHARLWSLFTVMFPRFEEMQRQTTRQIPLVVLRPA